MPTAPRLLVRHGTCVLPDGIRPASILIEGGRVLDLDPPANATADETIDATGLHVLPGLLDSHVHFREPGLDARENLASGSRAAAKGGVTAFFDMPNVVPPSTTRALIADRVERARRTSLVDFGFYIAATSDNLEELAGAGEDPGVSGIKIFIGSSTGDLLVDDQDALERIFAGTTLPICAHCEDETTVRANLERVRAEAAGDLAWSDHSRVRDEAAATTCVRRALDLAVRHRHRFHVLHVSTAAECTLIERCRAEHGELVTGEACPHHLLLDVSDYDLLGGRAQVNPSLKTAADREALWAALRGGVLSAVVTDHAPHLAEEKSRPYPQSPSGLPAVENSLALMLDAMHAGRCDLAQVVEWMCAAPARIWRARAKGRIAPGMDGDLVLVDLDHPHEIRDETQVTRCGWSPWHGRRVRGLPVRTIVRGRTVYDRGRFAEPGAAEPVRFVREPVQTA